MSVTVAFPDGTNSKISQGASDMSRMMTEYLGDVGGSTFLIDQDLLDANYKDTFAAYAALTEKLVEAGYAEKSSDSFLMGVSEDAELIAHNEEYNRMRDYTKTAYRVIEKPLREKTGDVLIANEELDVTGELHDLLIFSNILENTPLTRILSLEASNRIHAREVPKWYETPEDYDGLSDDEEPVEAKEEEEE